MNSNNLELEPLPQENRLPKPLESPNALVTHSKDAAAACQDIVSRTSCKIQGKRYVKVEGWQAIATAHGCVASSREVQRVSGGFTAIGEIRKISDGTLIGQAEGFVGDDEDNSPEYAKRAKAQTRAISRAARAAFAHVVVLMTHPEGNGFETTPAEEVPREGFPARGSNYPTQPPKTSPRPTSSGSRATVEPGSPEAWNQRKQDFLAAVAKEGLEFEAWCYATQDAKWMGQESTLGELQSTVWPSSPEEFDLVMNNIRDIGNQILACPEAFDKLRIAFNAAQSDGDLAPSHPTDPAWLHGETEKPLPSAVPAGQVMTKDDSWKSIKIHFGKNKDKTLGELKIPSLKWYLFSYEPKPYKGRMNPMDEALRKNLDYYKPMLMERYGLKEDQP